MKHLNVFIPATEAEVSDAESRCDGLHAAASGVLVPCPAPVTAAEGHWHPLVTFSHEAQGSQTLLQATSADPSGRYPLALSALKGGHPAVFGSTATPAYCAVATACGATVMTAEGPQHVFKSRGENAAEAVMAGTLPPVRPVRLEAELRGTATLNFEAMTLTGCTVTAGRTLDSASLRRIGRTMAEAYTDLAVRTQAAGLWFQPVVAFYRIRATDGSTLYTSPPKILCAPSGWQACAGIATPCAISGEAGDRTVSIPAFQTSVDTFRIKATVPADLLPGEWMKRVGGVEICVSPQIHPFDAADKAACSITGGTASTTITIALPGATSRLASLENRRMATARSVAVRCEEACAEVWRVDVSALSATEHHLTASRAATPAEESAAIKACTAKGRGAASPDGSRSLLRQISAPHAFSARSVATDGDSTLWGDITPLPYPGYPPEEFFGATDSAAEGEWDALTVTEFVDGRTVSALTSGTGYAPLSLEPLVSYPDAGAKSMTVWLRRGTAVSKATISLTPDERSGIALHLQSGLVPIELTPTAEPMPDRGTATAPGKRMPGAIASAPAGAPLSPKACVECSRAPIVAIAGAARSLSSWDFSRSHLHVFTTEGIYAVAVNASNRIASASLISARGVRCGEGVTATPEGTIAIAADGGGAILVKASKASAINLPEGAESCVHCQATGRTWLGGSDGNVWVMRGEGFHRPGLTATALYDGGGVPLLLTPEGITACPGEAPAAATEVHWRREIAVDRRRSLIAVEWMLDSGAFSGSLSVRAHGGSGDTYPVVKCEAEGPINSPVALRVAAPPRPYLVLELKGSAGADFRFKGVRLIFARP